MDVPIKVQRRQMSRLRLHDNYESTQELNPGQCLSKALLFNSYTTSFHDQVLDATSAILGNYEVTFAFFWRENYF